MRNCFPSLNYYIRYHLEDRIGDGGKVSRKADLKQKIDFQRIISLQGILAGRENKTWSWSSGFSNERDRRVKDIYEKYYEKGRSD